MFGRKKINNPEDEDIAFVEESRTDISSVPALKPINKVEKTVMGEGVFLEGNIRSEEHLAIEGSMKGVVDIPNHDFRVGAKARFEGEINALNVNIAGQMIGEIKCLGRVVITKDANFQGVIKTKTISLEDGAYFKGSIELDQKQPDNSSVDSKTSNGELHNPTTTASKTPVEELENETNEDIITINLPGR
jgi:cytoskeletal protein CcmA (bactofilin family)